MRMLAIAGLVLALGVATVGGAAADAQPQAQTPQAWPGCCGATPWPQGPGMMGGHGGMMGGHGSGMMGRGMGGGMMGPGSVRDHAAMMGGVPAPYAGRSNPLPRTSATVERGAEVYAANCASCHGPTGFGDGPAGLTLSPRPANLAWLSRMPMSNWDPFMFWTVSEGGSQFGSAMPSFKDSLSDQDRWAVIAYVQAHLPRVKARR